MGKNNDSQIRQEIFSLIHENQYCYLATALNNQPFLRPMVLFYAYGRFWIVTLKGDAKVQQIQNNQQVEVCIPIHESGDTGFIRAQGSAKIIRDINIKKEAIDFCYFFDDYFEGADDPDYTLIELIFGQMQLMRPGESYSTKISI